MNISPIIIKGTQQIDRAISIINSINLDGPTIEVIIRPHKTKRSLRQNRSLWGKLKDISEQVEWYGNKLTTEEWKDVFTAALKKQKVVPGIDGGFVVIGAHTSKMSVEEMSNLMELMSAFGAERGVKWKDYRDEPW